MPLLMQELDENRFLTHLNSSLSCADTVKKHVNIAEKNCGSIDYVVHLCWLQTFQSKHLCISAFEVQQWWIGLFRPASCQPFQPFEPASILSAATLKKSAISTKVHLLYKPRLTAMHSCGIFTPMAETSVENRTPPELHKGTKENWKFLFNRQRRF